MRIIHQTTCPGTLEQNRVVERKNRYLLEVSRALMFTMNVPKTFWSDALQTVVFLINMMSTWVLDFKTPIDVILSPIHFFLFLLRFLGASVMFILINLIGLNLFLSLLSASFWAMLLVRRVTSVITLLLSSLLS